MNNVRTSYPDRRHRARGPGCQKPSFNDDGRRRETAGWTRNAKRKGGFGTSFYGAISGYIFAAQVLTWRPRPPLLPNFLGTSPGVPYRSHGSAATACHSVSAVDFARQGRQYLACECSGGGKLNLSAGRRIHCGGTGFITTASRDLPCQHKSKKLHCLLTAPRSLRDRELARL